jgi:hypothetical protein
MPTAGSWAAARRTPSRKGRTSSGPAWQAAGRDGTPRTAALAYYALGDTAKEDANAYLRDYYGFLGDYAGMVADSAATDADTVRAYVQGFEAVGCDELILFPSNPDPGQVDLLGRRGLPLGVARPHAGAARAESGGDRRLLVAKNTRCFGWKPRRSSDSATGQSIVP